MFRSYGGCEQSLRWRTRRRAPHSPRAGCVPPCASPRSRVRRSTAKEPSRRWLSWSNEGSVRAIRKLLMPTTNLRNEYEAAVYALRETVAERLRSGSNDEDVARWVVG